MTIETTERVAVLLIFVNEAELWFDRPLYEAVVLRLRDLGVAGATATAGLIGFGHHHLMHQRSSLFGMTSDRPITITVVDVEEKIRQALPHVRALVQRGLVLLLRGDVVHLSEPAHDGEEA